MGRASVPRMAHIKDPNPKQAGSGQRDRGKPPQLLSIAKGYEILPWWWIWQYWCCFCWPSQQIAWRQQKAMVERLNSAILQMYLLRLHTIQQYNLSSYRQAAVNKSFMPRNKKDWRCWNVEMSSNRKETQLTFWLNEFYPGSYFNTNVFQTWDPSHSPKEGTIIKRSDFERVVQSKYTRP